ncbi:DNA-binding response regulator [Brevibacillus laterosporus]|uniref:DNA-binding response regulator n=1 Tax=Brevibacillus laterosporus TaxID=1465 RepID=A0A518V5S4_BRELA|nr:response regulator transcription factor [Brevibacillus laterosporus]QDX92328.1 DNA-binding response regulator [Brevibacillus laterosporus]TPG70637.1 DNA-binding response regulator [Brevibacillus laterosporus]
MEKIKVFLADDHRIVREGVKMILQLAGKFEIVGEAADGDELYIKVLECKPDLIISDLKMPGQSVLKSGKLLKEQLPAIKLLILTAFDDSEDIFQALDGGIDGYVMKDTMPEQILHTIDMILMGYSCFQPKLERKKSTQTAQLQLTEREREIFELIIDNLSNHEIAEKLYISEATVKTHVSSILRKTGQPNRSQAVLYALKRGLVKVK